ncbi:MAG: acetoacetate--CoA ligase [Myxococcota bacterium]
MSRPLWSPSPERADGSRLREFWRRAETETGRHFADSRELQRWSVESPEAFWRLAWEFCEMIGEPGRGPVLTDAERMPGARFFPEASLNFAENLLRRSDDAEALVFRSEPGERRSLTFRELRARVASLAAALRDMGVVQGDRVTAYLPNLPETVVAMLATTSLGAIWSSCSPDFGVRGVLDRFGQIEPKVLFAVDGYFYNGKTHDLRGRVAELRAGLPTLEQVIVVPFAFGDASAGELSGLTRFGELADREPAAEPVFEPLPFNHPLYILYSSGTTGTPKCIVHGAGGTLLKHLVEQRLHCDLRPGDRFFYFTTCGWMMWNWLVSGLASEATLLLYDGSPFWPDGQVLFDFAERERMTHFGTSAKYIDALSKQGVEPGRSHDLDSLRAILSTGSPLAPESFDYVYAEIKQDVWLASISGGTDIMGCFVLADPTRPVWRGEIQAPALGMKIEVFDDEGRPLAREKGELVCSAPFPSMPLRFWNDPGDERYRAAYFERFPGVWCHGDWVEWTEHGGMVIYGRSDAVLNPGGVRIGTAEIYRPVELIDEVVEAIATGQEWQNDVRVVLFLKLREGLELDDALRERVRREIRSQASPRHVPAVILQVADIPRTRSGKIVELAVREVIHGREVRNLEALANPEALDHFRAREELA